MSHKMTALAMEQKGLKPSAKIVLYWLADHHNGETGDCFPSHKRLADLCEMSRQSIINNIKSLEDAGLIRKSLRVRNNNSKTANAYELLLTDLSASPTHVKNLDNPCQKSLHGDVKKLDNHNLVINNLGIEPVYSVAIAFEAFWKVYPRKVKKAVAKEQFSKACQKHKLQEIMDGAKEYAQSVEGKDKKYIPHPNKWLKDERWSDEFEHHSKQVDAEFRGMVNDIAGNF